MKKSDQHILQDQRILEFDNIFMYFCSCENMYEYIDKFALNRLNQIKEDSNNAISKFPDRSDLTCAAMAIYYGFPWAKLIGGYNFWKGVSAIDIYSIIKEKNDAVSIDQTIRSNGYMVDNYYEFFKNIHKEAVKDNVNSPSHYTSGKIEVIDFIEDQGLGFNTGNAIKYIARSGKKDKSKTIEDLCKAQWYITREINKLKNEKL